MIAALAFMAGMSLASAPACPVEPPILPRVIQQTDHAGPPLAVAWIGQDRLVTVGEDGRMIFWDPATGRAIDNIAVPLPPVPKDLGVAIWRYRTVRLLVSADRRWAAVAVESANPNWETLAPAAVLVDLNRHTVAPPLAGRPEGWLTGPRLLAQAGGRLTIIDPEFATAPPTPVAGEFDDDAKAAVSVDGARFAATARGADGVAVLRVWRVGAGDEPVELGRFPMAHAPIEEVGFDRAGARVFARDGQGRLFVFGLEDGRRSLTSLAAALAVSNRPEARRDYLFTDLDGGALVVGDWAPDRTGAGACDCQTRVVDMRSGAVRARAPGRPIGVAVDAEGRTVGDADQAGGVIVVDSDASDGGDEAPLLGEAVRIDLVSGRVSRLGAMMGPPLAVLAGGARIAATGPSLTAAAIPASTAADGPPAVFVEATDQTGRRVPLGHFRAQAAADSAASPDGRSIAFLFRPPPGAADPGPIADTPSTGATEIRLWTPSARMVASVARAAGDFQSVRWLSNDRLVLHALDDPRSALVDLPTGQVREMPFGLAAPLDGPGRMVGWTRASGGSSRLDIFDPRTGAVVARPDPLPPWTDPQAATGAPRDIAVSPDGTLFAAAFAAHRSGCDMCAGDTWGRIALWDARGMLIGELRAPADAGTRVGPGRNFDIPDGLAFSADGRSLLALIGGTVHVWNIARGVETAQRPAAGWPGLDLPVSLTAELPDRRGRLGRQAVRWIESADGALSFSRGGALFTLYLLPNYHWLVTAPDGRYDTDLAADTPDIRWLVPDEPDRSLAPQTFMRDYFEPDLAARVLACTAAADCAARFPPKPDLACLDRVLPEVRSIRVLPGSGPGRALVEVEAAEGVRPDAANGRTRSGLYDLRLFRDGKLVAQWPPPPSSPANSGARSVAAWRAVSAVPDVSDGVARRTFEVALPTRGSGNGTVQFSAYAFNADRVKGETVDAVPFVLPPARDPRPRRAYVIAVGVDAYRKAPGHALDFAAADAHAMAAALARVRGYRVSLLTLTAETGRPSRADKADIHAAFDILAGRDPDAARRVLAGAGMHASNLAQVTPDDLVIVTFSGHGWTDATGDFFLLPADAVMAEGAAEPDPASLISSADLTDWLRDVDAGEMTLIIDACHSAASVEAPGFKPGPLGDAGLGQLAYDKGIRILAATQADSVALESAALHGGLLTFALTHDGLGLGGGRPEAPADWAGDIPLDGLLAWALDDTLRLERRDPSGLHAGLMPRLSRPLLVPRDPGPPARPIQLPSLFDFNAPFSRVAIVPPDAAEPDAGS